MSMTAAKSPPIAPHKLAVEIESLLRWAFREELPKRQISSAEGIWRDMEISGPFGQVDSGSSGAQRYPHHGLPHRDAIAIEAAVLELPLVEIDWNESLDAIMGDLTSLMQINDLKAPLQPRPTASSWNEKAFLPRERTINHSRDVIMDGSVQTAALIQSHASQGTRPKWFPDQPTCHPTPSRDPSKAMLVGQRGGRNLYSIGSHCPLTWRPSPIAVAQHRADYIGWWRGLSMLAEALELDDHAALPPLAPQLPWFDAEAKPWVYGDPAPRRMGALPLKPQREMAGRTRGQGEDVRRTPGRRVVD